MTETLLILVLAYVFLLAILLLNLLNANIKLGAKAMLLLLAVCFYFYSYQGWKQAQGWPAAVAMPDKFLLHYAVIEEPDKQLNSQGNIYLWLTDLADDKPAQHPRAYRLDYQQATHVEVAKAMNKIQNGNLQIGVKLSNKGKIKQQAKKAKGLGTQALSFEFVDLPDPALPEK